MDGRSNLLTCDLDDVSLVVLVHARGVRVHPEAQRRGVWALRERGKGCFWSNFNEMGWDGIGRNVRNEELMFAIIDEGVGRWASGGTD